MKQKFSQESESVIEGVCFAESVLAGAYNIIYVKDRSVLGNTWHGYKYLHTISRDVLTTIISTGCNLYKCIAYS